MWIALGMAAMSFVMPAALADDDDKAKPEAEDFDRTGADTEKHELDAETIEEQKMSIDKMADSAMKELFASSQHAKELFDKAYGHAVFSVVKVAVGITGGGGEGVAIAKRAKDEPIYMDMATGGIGVGLGGQKYRTIFLFEDQKAFDEFVFDGWEADAEANAAAGTEGANAAASFSEGVAVYQFTDKGLLANVDVSGTKYWIDEDLNHPSLVERSKETEEDREKTD
jgi:lipid-binding SYLF domain-containing protein